MSAEKYLDALAAGASTILGDRLTGVYLAGSLALDDFDPRRSDIDVALVVKSKLACSIKQSLAQTLCHSIIPCPVRGLESVTYTESAAATVSRTPAFEMELNDGPRMDHRLTLDPADRPVSDGTFWYAIDRDILHQAGRALIGPPSAEVFSAVPDGELLPLLLEAMDWQNTRRAGAIGADSVLNACRSWLRIRTGHWYGKSEAGVRVAESEPKWAPIALDAVASRCGGTDGMGDDHGLLAAIHERLTAIR